MRGTIQTILNDASGNTFLASRQNLPIGGKDPWIVSGCYEGIRGYQTDASQFLGTEFKRSGKEVGLAVLEPEFGRLQREFAAHVLYSKWISLKKGEEVSLTFFSSFNPDHKNPTSQKDLALVPRRPRSIKISAPLGESVGDCENIFSPISFFPTGKMDEQELKSVFPGKWTNIEKAGGELLSFHVDTSTHVVMPEKDMGMQKTHGHIMRGGKGLYPDDNNISATAWIAGIFASHISIGNPTSNRFVSISAGDQWNALRATGLRIFVSRNGRWEMLGMPSVFFIEYARCVWIYKHADGKIRIETATDENNRLIVSASFEGEKFRSIVFIAPDETNNISHVMEDSRTAKLFSTPGSRFASAYPEAFMKATFEGELESSGGDEIFMLDGKSCGVNAVGYFSAPQKKFSICFSGRSTLEDSSARELDVAGALKRLPLLETSSQDDTGDRLNSIISWFFHNAMIHFSKPYGLEQFTGGGWGTRDVSQGPMEVMLSVGAVEDARKILCKIYSKQYLCDGDWPQAIWYDRYGSKQPRSSSHGDIVVWPLKAVCEYLEATEDYAVLDTQLPYVGDDGNPTRETEPLSKHIARQLARIKACFVPGTSLVAYGHGDWNDSLQPAKPELAKNLVSSWTVELVYQSVRHYSELCHRKGDKALAGELDGLHSKVRDDFNKYLVRENLVTGLALRSEDGAMEPLFHPMDKRTGIQHSLLPSTRGIISEIFDKEQAEKHVRRIEEHLLAPDGARLMDCPPRYHGGEMKLFQRAETATFFGREIGIQYVHSHLRYAEAMAKIGNAEKLLWAFMVANPVMLRKTLPKANLRQSNTYFTSSDADFKDRYESEREYGRIRRDEITFSGGWRIYSSGPGIYVSLIRKCLLGLRRHYGRYIFDPVIAAKLDGLKCRTHIEGVPVTIRYDLGGREFGPDTITVNGKKIENAVREENPYRKGGLSVDLAELLGLLKKAPASIVIGWGKRDILAFRKKQCSSRH